MEGIIALIVAGSIFRTPGTWAVTRGLSILDVVVAIFYSYTPARPYLGRVWLAMLALTAAVWIVNIVRFPRVGKES